MKKFLKLINDERVSVNILPAKGCGLYQDYAVCEEGSYDFCRKVDKAGCYNYANDTCTYDYDGCDGEEQAWDNCSMDV